jgi:hypothetical protein
MGENERRVIQHDSQYAQVQLACKGEGAYPARRKGRATRDARGAELATRELPVYPAVRHDAEVRHGRAILGGVRHPACVRSALPPFSRAPGQSLSTCLVMR